MPPRVLASGPKPCGAINLHNINITKDKYGFLPKIKGSVMESLGISGREPLIDTNCYCCFSGLR